MRTQVQGNSRFVVIRRAYKTADDIAKTINRSRSYVFKAMKVGFTEREMEMLIAGVARENERQND